MGWSWGTKGFSRITGSNRIPLLFVGEASGAAEEQKGEPFIGKAGQVLQRALDVSGLRRDDYSITNIVRCRPPGNELRGAPYERAAIDHCKSNLDQAIVDRRPRLILALGDVPLRELSVFGGGISDMRGFVLQSVYGIPLIATYHPSHLARGAFHLFGAFQHDVRRAQSYALRGVPNKLETNYVTNPTGLDVSKYLDQLRADRSLASAYDLETKGILGQKEPKGEETIIQIQFSSAAGQALVLEWPKWKDAAIEILATENPKWGWNDRLFDRKILKRYGVRINGEQHDLMNAWAHLQPNFVSSKDDAHGDKGVPARLMGLQSCVSFYFPYEGPWKGMVEHAVNSPDLFDEIDVRNALQWYGGRDADMTFRCGVRLFDALRKAGLW